MGCIKLHILNQQYESTELKVSGINKVLTSDLGAGNVRRGMGYMYFHDRYYDPELSIFLSVDKLAYRSPHLTSYHYCSNNPIGKIDPDGKDDYWINESGKIELYQKTNATRDRFFWGEITKNDKGEITNTNYISINKEKAEDKTFTASQGYVDIKGEKNVPYNRYDFKKSGDAQQVYDFITEKNGAKNEWGLSKMFVEGRGEIGILTSGGRPSDEPGSAGVQNWYNQNKNSTAMFWISHSHNHPNPLSGGTSRSDREFARAIRGSQKPDVEFFLNINGKKPIKY